MARTTPIDEELVSGYLDGALTHTQAQRVRLLIEDDPDTRMLFEELRALRDTARSTKFHLPADEDWPELPSTRSSWVARKLGWTVTIVWLSVVTIYALWRFLSETGDPLEIFLVLGLPGGFLLLFLSVLLDRLKALKNDRYRNIHR
ncbi:MAG: hypothetical protein AAGD38_12830 [Acidobacteriota bacterium]